MSRDLRRYARQTQARLLAGLFTLVYLLGVGLIYFFYGKEPALMALLCLLAALAPVAVVLVILAVINWIVKRANPD
jgi:hypothetical protein